MQPEALKEIASQFKVGTTVRLTFMHNPGEPFKMDERTTIRLESFLSMDGDSLRIHEPEGYGPDQSIAINKILIRAMIDSKWWGISESAREFTVTILKDDPDSVGRFVNQLGEGLEKVEIL